MLTTADFDLNHQTGPRIGTLRVSCRSGHESKGKIPLLEKLSGGEKVALLEESEYLYELELREPIESLEVWPRELFDSDDPSGLKGRLKTSDHVGDVWVRVYVDERELGSSRLEVRSAKLEYETDYRRMLSSIAADGAELLMQRFSPASAEFTPTTDQSARTLYQRFAFLQSSLMQDSFEAAIQQIVRKPHHAYLGETYEVAPGMGGKSSSHLSRQFSRSGPRIPWPDRSSSEVLPTKLSVTRFKSTNDTEPNRFVKFVLTHWRTVCADIHERLKAQDYSAPIERGLRETARLIDRLDQILAYPLFRYVTGLRQLPIANQTLQKREGYRELLRLFIQSEAAANLNWQGGEDVFGAGQRDASTLYEYWVYLQLRKIVSRFCIRELSLGSLFDVSSDGLGLALKRGEARALHGSLQRFGRSLTIELWFNRSFKSESWTRIMRPDCSLLISATPGFRGSTLETWLHFDAKYRAERLNQLFGDDELGEADKRSDEKRADLLKMHAYRDAIRRSSGAYVIYPGDVNRERANHKRYEEVLPGLGAFPLRPGPDGDADATGTFALASFIDDVLSHTASQVSQRERADFWNKLAHTSETLVAKHSSDFLDEPPADTPVLLGYVKSREHLEWIHQQKLYNLRADERTGSIALDARGLGARFVLLYGKFAEAILFERVGDPLLLTSGEMLSRGYPDPGGRLYCCLQLGKSPRPTFEIASEIISDMASLTEPGAPFGTPVLTTWQAIQAYVE